ncbi:MAG: hypothetical protein Q8Q92_01275 [bacterium]|nr:hypothetical protein [bacterium]
MMDYRNDSEEVNMDREYILMIKSGGKTQSTEPFHAPTPEEARDLAKMRVRKAQAESVDEFPFAPAIMTGELYRQIEEINGAQFIQREPTPSRYSVIDDGEWLDNQF